MKEWCDWLGGFWMKTEDKGTNTPHLVRDIIIEASEGLENGRLIPLLNEAITAVHQKLGS